MRGFAEYVNVSRVVAAVVSSRLASLVDLDTVLGAQDLYTLLEILTVDAHNDRVANQPRD